MTALTLSRRWVRSCQLPLDHRGQTIREVAPARFALPLPDQPGQFLPLGVALIRDHRRQAPAPSGEEDEGNDEHFARWREGWKAQPWWISWAVPMATFMHSTPSPARLSGRRCWGHRQDTINWSSPALYHGSIYVGAGSLGDCPLVQGRFISWMRRRGTSSTSLKGC